MPGNGFEKRPWDINRKGRPRKGEGMTDMLRNVLSEEVVEVNGVVMTGKEVVARKALELALKGDMTAIKMLYDRNDGLPVQAVRHVDADDNDIDMAITVYSPKEREERLKTLLGARDATKPILDGSTAPTAPKKPRKPRTKKPKDPENGPTDS